MKTLIYSHFYELPGASSEKRAGLRDALDLWWRHLRGPGRYTGDILLFTNVPDVRGGEFTTRPFSDSPIDPLRAFLRRVLLAYQEVPARDYDVVMQMDVDILAVDDVLPLFPRDERLWAAPSNLPLLDWRHTWRLLPRWRRHFHKLTGWRMRDAGVSACVVASAGAVWERNFGAWARVISEHAGRPIPRQADQSYLNLLLLRGTVPIAAWSRDLICHRDWENATRARLLHFPGHRKEYMKRYRKV